MSCLFASVFSLMHEEQMKRSCAVWSGWKLMSSVVASHGGQTKEVLGEPREDPGCHWQGRPTEQLKTVNHGGAAADSALKFLKVNVEIVVSKRSLFEVSAVFSLWYFFCLNNAMQCNGLSDPQNVETFLQPLLFAPGGSLLGHHHHMACNCRGSPLHRGRGGSSKSKVNFSSEPSKWVDTRTSHYEAEISKSHKTNIK